MSFMLNPAVSGLLDTQLSNLSYLMRGWFRVSGEQVGLPQAVPETRKMDYQFRDFFMVFVTAYLTEVAYRGAEQFYTIPNLIQQLDLNRLKDIYTSGSIHTPAWLKANPQAIKNIGKELPPVLQDKMLSSLINPRSYYAIPHILESQTIPEMVAKKASQKNIDATRLLAHHLRKILNPEQYLEQFLLAEGRITPKEAQVLKGYLGQLDELAGLFAKAKESASLDEVYQRLQVAVKDDPSKAARQLQKLSKDSLRRVLSGSTWMDLFRDVRKYGLSKAWTRSQQFKQLSKHAALASIQSKPQAVGKLLERLKVLMKEPALKDSVWLKEVTSYNEAKLWKFLQGPPLWGQKALKDKAKQFTSESVYSALRENVMLPLVKYQQKGASKLIELFETLSLSKLKLKNLQKVFEGGQFWLKLPLSILGLFLFYGLLANKFDAKTLQPYQREIVKQRGDSTEFTTPGYVGAIPGLLVFGLLMKMPFIKRLGYVGSFATSGFLGLSTYAATTMALFQAKLRQDRKPPVIPQQPVFPIAFPEQPYTAATPQNNLFKTS